MDRRGIKYRQRTTRFRYQQADFGAAEDNALRALRRQRLDDLQIIVARGVAKGAEAQLIKNNLIDARPIVSLRDQRLNGKLLLQTAAIKSCSMV